MAAEFATSIATTIFEHSLGAIVRHVGYLWNHKKNLADLETRVNKLDNVRNDKSHSVLVAQRNAERIKNQVECWQDDAEKISLEARNIMELYEENAKKRCLIGLCPNVASHYQLSRKACKKQLEIVEALTEANQFNAVSDRAVRRAMSTVSIEGYLTFDSRKSTLEEIMKTLKDATKNLIGVYGLGGIGKTTLAKQVASRAAEEKLFDEIVMAPVTQTPELKEIQGEIAKKLGLKLEELSVAERAGRIHERLRERKVLVILDDLLEKLDLEKVGIPFGLEHKGCKLLFTSRYQWVLSSMGTSKDFHLGALEEEEAWRLFEERTADVVKDLAFLDIGKKVAKRCAGLPVLIVTVAASLSSRPRLPAWKDALKELRKMNNKEVHEIVNSALELISYEHLQKTHKRLFLLCGLLGSGFLISDLLKYSWGWDFFDEDVLTLEEARNKLHNLILDLKASCLLIDGDNEDIIYIHDVIRGVAISVAQKDQNMLRVGDGETELIRWPNDDVLRSCTAMIFDDFRDFSRLPQRLECPLLEFFFLRRITLDASSTIPDTFFQKIRELKVLDMTHVCFSGLPSSLSCLQNLQTLCLDGCTNMKDIYMIGELKRLQVLSFIGADIKELPRGIGQLSELRLLDLSRCSKLEIIPAGLLEGLSNLEELYMRKSFNKWEAEEFHRSNSERTSNVSLAELKHLPKLRSLEIEVEDAKLLTQDLNFERLERYRIIAGYNNMNSEIDKKGISRKLGVDLVTAGINHLQNGVKGLLKRAECVCLRKLEGIKNVVDELDGDGLPELKHLTIRSNSDIQYIVNVEFKQQRVFPALESLYLYNLLKLEKICNSRLMQDSFCKLTTVNVQDCNKLESLFSFSMAIGLPCLQELQVYGCSILKGIVAKKSDGAASEKIEFVQLRKLSLGRLPQLMSFYSIVREKQKYMKTGVQSGEIVSEEEEPSSSMSFFKEVSFPSLEELSLFGISNLTEIWNHKLLEKSYWSLKSLLVVNCACLANVFSFNLLQLSRNLEVLHISNCAKLEEVFVVPEELDIDEHNGLVPQLVELSLIDLPELRCMWRNYHPSILSFKNLKKLSVEKCANLKYLFTPSITMGLVQLQELRIECCETMKKIVVKEPGETIDAVIFPQLSYLCLVDLPNLTTFYSVDEEMGSNEDIAIQPLFSEKANFPNLEQLRVISCGSLKYLFTPSGSTGLVRLQKMTIEHCGMMKKFVANEEGETTTNTITLPQLIEYLPNLTTFYSGDEEMGSNENIVIQPLFNEKANFPSLEKLRMIKCGSLKYLFTPSVAMGLVRLQELIVQSCVMMKNIVVNEEGETTDTVITMPHLSLVHFEKLRNLSTFYSGDEEICSNENIHSVIQPLFNDKVNLPSLKSLEICGLDNIGCIWHNQPYEEDSLCKLEVVEVERCAKLLKIFPSTMLNKIHSVKKICILYCKAFEEVFEDQKGLNLKEITNGVTIVSQLRDLYLIGLPKLRFVWKKDFHKIVSFENLWDVEVRGCESLKSVFPACVAQRLHQLKKLCIEDCTELETIVEEDGDENKEVSPTTFIFPQLTTLYLVRLPKVDCFYPKKHTLECPVLVKLVSFSVCDQISILDFLLFSGTQLHNQSLELLSRLTRLTIRSKHMKTMTRRYGHFPSELFLNLRELRIIGFYGDESAVFPSKFLYGLHKLETLTIKKSSFQEMFPYEGEEPSLLLLLPHLKQLYLENLPELKYICTQNSPFFPILDKLVCLRVEECPRLTNLVPTASVSFKLLEELTVQVCGGLINLISSSAAASLENLRLLTIRRCQMIEEIVAADDGDVDAIIIFSDLCWLELEDLPRLTSFCTANNYTFKFPSLGRVIVRQCPNMRTFSPGITITPMLDRVSFGDAQLWKGDLNTTIQHFFSEMKTPRLTAADPSTSSSNHHSEPEAQIHDNPTESAANEIQDISEESTKQREEGQTSEVAKTENAIEPREEIEIFEEPNDLTGENVDICNDATKPGKGKEKIEMSVEDPNYQDQASSSCTSTMPFYGESSVSEEQQSEKSEETVPEEQTNAGSLAPRHVVASSSLLSPPRNPPQTSPSLVTEAGTSRAASNSQQWDFQGLRVRKEFIALLSEFLQIYQTQPLNTMSAQQVQFMVNAFRDLSTTNFSIEWFSPYVEKARERLSVVEREKEICELDLKISEAEAHLQSLRDRKRTLEEKNEAFASSLDLDN